MTTNQSIPEAPNAYSQGYAASQSGKPCRYPVPMPEHGGNYNDPRLIAWQAEARNWYIGFDRATLDSGGTLNAEVTL